MVYFNMVALYYINVYIVAQEVIPVAMWITNFDAISEKIDDPDTNRPIILAFERLVSNIDCTFTNLINL